MEKTLEALGPEEKVPKQGLSRELRHRSSMRAACGHDLGQPWL